MSPRLTNQTPGQARPDTNRTDRQAGLAASRAQSGLVAAVCVVLAVATLGLFWPVSRFDFINLDDPAYFSANPHVLGGLTWKSVLGAFRTELEANWHPLTWLSFMLDVTLFGPGPRGPHLVNLLLHTGNSVLVFLLLRRMTGALWQSAAVAALFALHPLRVESVAWVAERKDVLSGLFFLLTLWAYVRYAEHRTTGSRDHGIPGPQDDRTARLTHPVSSIQHSAPSSQYHASHLLTRPALWYSATLLLFALGLMSKPMLVTVPVVLLLLDRWPLGRLGEVQNSTFKVRSLRFARLVWEKAPFFLLSGVFALVTYKAQSHFGAVVDWARLPLQARLENAIVSYARYLGKTFWPVCLAVPYPHPGGWPWGPVMAATILLAVICVGVAWLGRRRPYLVLGWFWWLVILLPVIGLTQAGGQAMADRFTYLPAIGLFVGLVWGVAEWAGFGALRQLTVGVVAVAALMGCCLRTVGQLRYWRDSETLFRHTLTCTSNNAVAHNSLGAALAARGKWDEAVEHYHLALQIFPGFPSAHGNLAGALLMQGKWTEAVEHCDLALKSDPNLPETRINLASALLGQGKTDDAIQQCELVLKAAPTFPEAHATLASALAAQGKWNETIQHYELALQTRPAWAEAQNNLGSALAAQGQWQEAVQRYELALKAKPGFAPALNNLAEALVIQGKWAEAIQQCRQALRSDPNLGQAHVNLGNALVAQGEWAEAIEHYQLALKANPRLAKVHNDLGLALARTRQWGKAIAHYQEALALQPEAVQPQNNLAWLLATCPEAGFRDGDRAVALAQEMNRLSGGQNPDYLDTLAAAYAEAGTFSEATQVAERAVALALAQTNSHLAELRARLELYRKHSPYHNPNP